MSRREMSRKRQLVLVDGMAEIRLRIFTMMKMIMKIEVETMRRVEIWGFSLFK
jgi:hypothetical protein